MCTRSSRPQTGNWQTEHSTRIHQLRRSRSRPVPMTARRVSDPRVSSCSARMARVLIPAQVRAHAKQFGGRPSGSQAKRWTRMSAARLDGTQSPLRPIRGHNLGRPRTSNPGRESVVTLGCSPPQVLRANAIPALSLPDCPSGLGNVGSAAQRAGRLSGPARRGCGVHTAGDVIVTGTLYAS